MMDDKKDDLEVPAEHLEDGAPLELLTADEVAMSFILTGADLLGWDLVIPNKTDDDAQVEYLVIGVPEKVKAIVEKIDSDEKK